MSATIANHPTDLSALRLRLDSEMGAGGIAFLEGLHPPAIPAERSDIRWSADGRIGVAPLSSRPKLVLVVSSEELRRAKLVTAVSAQLPISSISLGRRLFSSLHAMEEQATRRCIRQLCTLDVGGQSTDAWRPMRRFLQLAFGQRTDRVFGTSVELLLMSPDRTILLLGYADPNQRGAAATRLLEQYASRYRKKALETGNQKEYEASFKAATKCAAFYQRVGSLIRSGYSASEVARATRASEGDIHRWKQGQLPAPLMGVKCSLDRMDRTDQPLPLTWSRDLAFVLGALFGVANKGERTRHYTVRFKHTDREVIDRLEGALRVVVGGAATVSRTFADNYHVVRVSAQRFFRALDRMTAGRTDVPTSFFRDEDEKRAVLQGFLAFVGSFGPTQFEARLKNRPRVAVQVATLFADLGVVPLVRDGAYPGLFFSDHQSLARIRELDLFLVPSLRTKLDALVARSAPTRRSYSCEEYDRARTVRDEEPGISAREIALRLGFGVAAVENWFCRELPPKAVLRRDRLRALVKRLKLEPAEATSDAGEELIESGSMKDDGLRMARLEIAERLLARGWRADTVAATLAIEPQTLDQWACGDHDGERRARGKIRRRAAR